MLRIIYIITIVSFTACTGLADERGPTVDLEERQPVILESPLEATPLSTPPTYQTGITTWHLPDTIYWHQTDSLSLWVEIPARGRCILSFDPDADSIEIIQFPDTLTTLAQEAIDYAPSWLWASLAENFRRLGAEGDTFASLILNAYDSRFVDEIAYQIAHLGAETLVDSTFDPLLVVANAEFLYENDQRLQYVEIVDYGSPPGDYYSTTRYQVLDEGDTITYEIPKEIYYQSIVHPQLSDESPRMDGYVYDRFWRDYIFYAADTDYPSLEEKLAPVKVLWDAADTAQVYSGKRSFDTTDVALDVIGNWGSWTLPDAAGGNRPIQPNVIAHEHNGNCGECQDLMQAAARAALVPCEAAMDICDDHVWNEFYYEVWRPYQLDLGGGATRINDPRVAYDQEHGGSKQVASVWIWGSDGYSWDVTNKYSGCCSLSVGIWDYMGLPVDSCRVLIYSEYLHGGYQVAGMRFPDITGMCGFELGDFRDFRIHIDTPFGGYPSDDPDSTELIIEDSQPGASYIFFRGTVERMPQPEAEPADPPGDTLFSHKMDIVLASPHRLDHGWMRSRRSCENQEALYHSYSRAHESGVVDLYVVDEANYAAYLDTLPFEAALIGNRISGATVSFIAPTEDRWYLVLSNECLFNTDQEVELQLVLYRTSELHSEENPEVDGVHCFALRPVSPNPFSSQTGITYSIASKGNSRSAPTSLVVYDCSGRKVRSLTDGNHQPGTYQAYWNGTDERGRPVGSGIYFCRLTSGEKSAVQKMILVR